MGGSPLSSGGDDPRTTADAAVAAWEDIAARLEPVLGRRGAAALYRRSVHLTLAHYPWLAPAYEGPAQATELATLHAALAAQDGSAAAAASAELLVNFRALLANLIGEALSARLLAPPQPASPDADTPQDTLP